MSVARGGQISEPVDFLPEFLGLRPHPWAQSCICLSGTGILSTKEEVIIFSLHLLSIMRLFASL